MEDDPLAGDPIERDQYGRPKIIPATKAGKPQPNGKLVPYTRASTMSDAIMDAGGLLSWSLWHLALGLGRNPDLAALAGCYGPTVDNLSKSDKAELNDVIERARDRSGGNVKADHGTAVHALTEPDPLGYVPDRMAADIAAYHDAMHTYGLVTVLTETFIVNDEVKAAGTFDHAVRLTRDLTLPLGDKFVTLPAGEVLILDKKTGKVHYDSNSIQLAIYANGKTYNPVTGERGTLEASREWGIVAHIPMGAGKANLHLINLRLGWAATKLAVAVRDHRTRKDLGFPFPPVGEGEPLTPAVALSGAAAPANNTLGSHAAVDAGHPREPDIAPEQPDEAVARATKIAANEATYQAALTSAHEEAKAKRDAAAQANMEAESTRGEREETQAVGTVTDILGARPLVTLAEKLHAAGTRDDLSAVWREHQAPGVEQWTDEHTVILRARAAEIDALAA